VAEILNVEEVSHDLIATVDPSMDGRLASSSPNDASANRNGEAPWPVLTRATYLTLHGTRHDGKW
jgi:hypothetical protein